MTLTLVLIRRNIIHLSLSYRRACRNADTKTAHDIDCEREILVRLAKRLQDKRDTKMAIVMLPDSVA